MKKLINDHKEDERNITRKRASRRHQGPGHWHVEKRSNVIICGNCGVSIPKWKNPKYCPDCGAGRSASHENRSRQRQTN